jgi:hypothetical protein
MPVIVEGSVAISRRGFLGSHFGEDVMKSQLSIKLSAVAVALVMNGAILAGATGWSVVQPNAAKLARDCACNGASLDSAPKPRIMVRVIDELHGTLQCTRRVFRI